MHKNRNFYWLWAAIGLLLLLNLATVGWVVRRLSSMHDNRQSTEEILIRRLDFTPRQVAKYRQSRSQMQTQIKPHEDSLQHLQMRLLDQIKQPPIVSDTPVNQILDQTAGQNKQIAQFRFRHWQQVRALGTPDQQARFDQLLTRLEQGINKANRPGGLRERLRNRF